MPAFSVYQQPAILFFPATYYGHWWDETIQGNSIASNTIWGYGGNDWLYGNVGTDWLFGGPGDDHLYGVDGNDNLLGDIGDDTAWGGNGNDNINGEDGNDTLFGEAGDDRIYGGDGVDVIHSGEGADEIHGDNGNDWLYLDGNGVFGTAYGGDGDDYLESSRNFGVLDGGNGDDNIYGGDFSDVVYAGDGDDTVVAGDGSDEIHAGNGKDKVFAGEGNDWIFLGPDTYAEGNAGNDTFTIDPEQVNGATFTAVGGEGHDTFRMDYIGIGAGMVTLPLAAISLRVESVEELDVSNMNDADMTLKAADILDFTETGVLQIDGNKNEVLHLEGGGWKDAGVNGGFHDYVAVSNNQLVTAHVDTEIQVVIA